MLGNSAAEHHAEAETDTNHVGKRAFFGCAYCTEAFPEKSQLEVHEKMTHPGAPFASVAAPLPERERELLHKAPTGAISKSIPVSEIARHCTPEDCWVALNGQVYNLTEFMDRHPGGPTTILTWAGKEASAFFNKIHTGVKVEQYLRPEALVGDLGVDEDLMSNKCWHTLKKARIAEIRELLARLEAPEPSGGTVTNISIARLLQVRDLEPELKAKLRMLETQKRVALDTEDYEKASEIKAQEEALLAEGSAGVPATKGATVGIPLSEVARHNKPHDCWVALNGVVYDLTDMLLHHPEQRNSILAWAGRDATPMWDKIPGRFPSSTWMEFFMRPEARLDDLGSEPVVDPKVKEIEELHEELRHLEGPAEEDILAAKAARGVALLFEALQRTEEERFPRLKQAAVKKELPYFTRAEVAKHKGPPGGPPGTEPWMILHNKVYDLEHILGFHPMGDDLLLSRAGTDATQDFELFEHSEKTRVRRDEEMLVGRLVPAECTDWGGVAAAGGQATTAATVGKAFPPDVGVYLRQKAADLGLCCVALYAYWAYQRRKPLSNLTYSRGLRHLHLIMALGTFGAIGSAQAASRLEGAMKKRCIALHKQLGVAMLAGLFLRFFSRLRSDIPPRFPAHPLMQFVETQSLRAFYVLLLALPVSGLANEYYLRWAPGAEETGNRADDDRNARKAKDAMAVHLRLGKILEYAWMPFHLGYTVAYHYSRGRGVVRKVSPFI